MVEIPVEYKMRPDETEEDFKIRIGHLQPADYRHYIKRRRKYANSDDGSRY